MRMLNGACSLGRVSKCYYPHNRTVSSAPASTTGPGRVLQVYLLEPIVRFSCSITDRGSQGSAVARPSTINRSCRNRVTSRSPALTAPCDGCCARFFTCQSDLVVGSSLPGGWEGVGARKEGGTWVSSNLARIFCILESHEIASPRE